MAAAAAKRREDNRTSARRLPQFVLNKNTLLLSGPFIDVDRYEADRDYLISSDRAQLADVADELRASYG